MRKIYISNTDGLKCIKQRDSPQTLFYCDPPYIGTDQAYSCKFTFTQYLELINTLKEIKGSFILSGYNVENFELPREWKKREFKTYCSASGKGKIKNDRSRKITSKELGEIKRVEVVWRKINRKVRPEIQKLYDSGKFDCFKG